MFSDPTVESLVVHQLTKFAAGIVLLGGWWAYYQTMMRPALVEPQNEKQKRAFPMNSLLLMVALTGGFLYYVSMEHSFRDTRQIDAPLIEQRQDERGRRDAEFTPPDYQGPSDDLEQQTKDALEKARKQNDDAKKAFENLPAVKSNDDGGAAKQ